MFLLVHTQALMSWVLSSISVVVILLACIRSDWRALFSVSLRFHLFAGLLLVLLCLWWVVAIPVNEILRIHPLLITSMGMIFGWGIALCFGAGVLVLGHFFLPLYWENFGFHFLSTVCAPLLVTFVLFKLVQGVRLQIVFFYTLGIGFIGGMLSTVAAGAMSLGLLGIFNSTLYWPALDHFYLFVLLAFPEGFCNGVVVSSLAVVRPDLLRTFDDEFYFK
jgi:uncharacterized membrane protein